MNQPIKNSDVTVKENLKNLLGGIADLQTQLPPDDDEDIKQIAAALKYITKRLDDPAFPTEKDQHILNEALKLMFKAGKDSNIDFRQLLAAFMNK
jgi:hypothetical protein